MVRVQELWLRWEVTLRETERADGSSCLESVGLFSRSLTWRMRMKIKGPVFPSTLVFCSLLSLCGLIKASMFCAFVRGTILDGW